MGHSVSVYERNTKTGFLKYQQTVATSIQQPSCVVPLSPDPLSDLHKLIFDLASPSYQMQLSVYLSQHQYHASVQELCFKLLTHESEQTRLCAVDASLCLLDHHPQTDPLLVIECMKLGSYKVANTLQHILQSNNELLKDHV